MLCITFAIASIIAAAAPPGGPSGLDVTTRALGMADANRAIATGNDSVYLNPAGAAFGHRYTIEFDGVRDVATGGFVTGASVVDSTSSQPVAGAFSYTRWQLGDVTGNVVHLGFAYPASPKFLIGTTTKYLGLSGPDGDVSRWTTDIGALILTGPFSLGFVGQNLVPTHSALAPVGIGYGIAFGEDTTFRLAIDGTTTFLPGGVRALSTKAGAEYLVSGAFPIRAGVAYDWTTRAYDFAAGVGFVTPQAGIDLGYRQPGHGNGARYLGAALKFFIE